jgi:hypothetical protein
MVVEFTITVQSMPITTNVVSSNPDHDEVYLIQYYVIKFVNDLRQVGGFYLNLKTTTFGKNVLKKKVSNVEVITSKVVCLPT